MKRIAVLTGGGDAPGLNAVIRAVTKTAINIYGCEVLGIRDGYDGFITAGGVTPLDLGAVRGILPRGGTILGTANRGNPFARKVLRNGKEIVVDVSDKVTAAIQKLKLDALIVIGGDGTLRIAMELGAKGVPVVGVPKTIDNDIGGTEVTFGFDTALMIATEALDRLHTTAEAHHRVMVLELMGREAGFIALHSGVSGGADVILIPEIPFNFDAIVRKVRERPPRAARISACWQSQKEPGMLAGSWSTGCRVTRSTCLASVASARRLVNIYRGMGLKLVSPSWDMFNGVAPQQLLTAGLPLVTALRRFGLLPMEPWDIWCRCTTPRFSPSRWRRRWLCPSGSI